MQAALKTGMVSAHEARIALALRLNPELSGLRGLEIASGLCDDTVLKTIPAAEESSTLLVCSSRGSFAWEPEHRRPIELGHRSFVEHHHPSKTSQEPLGQEALEVPQESEGLKGLSARRMTGVLDPSLDMWANTDDGLGDHGWVLAMVTGLKAMTFTLDELRGILRIGERQVRRVLDKMGSWVRRVKEGRRALVTVDFSLLVERDEDELVDFLTTGRRDRKAAAYSYEMDVVQEMATDEGRMARTMWKNRLAEVRQLREYAALLGQRYDRMVQALEDTCRWRGQRALRKLLT